MTNTITSEEEYAIALLVERQRDAWNRGDAAAFAAGFTDDGCFVNVLGDITYGRQPFEAQHAKIFSTIYRGSVISLPIRRIRLVRSDVAIVDIDAELSSFERPPPGVAAESEGVIRTRLQEILVKEGDRWTIASFHNVDVKVIPRR